MVTGGTGFIGSRLVNTLVDAGHRVCFLTRRNLEPPQNNQIEIVHCDLLNTSFDLCTILEGCSVVFNCAGEIHDEKIMPKLHIEATQRLVDACKAVVAHTQKPIHFVQLSSVGAYGPSRTKASDKRIVTEETPPAPLGAYEVTKTKADEILIASAEENLFSYCIVRPSIVYGPCMPNNSLRELGTIIQKKIFFYIGKPGAISTLVHVDDVVEAMLLCGFKPEAKNEIFNVSNDCKQEELVNGLAKALHVKPPRVRLPEILVRLLCNIFSHIKSIPITHSRIDALVSRTTYPTDKMYKTLSFKPKRDVENTIEEVFDRNCT